MKKLSHVRWFVLGIAFTLIMAALVTPGNAMVGSRNATLVYQDIKITLNGNDLVPKDAVGNVVEPFIIDGTTYLPVRAISEALGLEVDWDDETGTVKMTNPVTPSDPIPVQPDNPVLNQPDTPDTPDETKPTGTPDKPKPAAGEHYFATSLKEISKKATGNIGAILYDIDGCGIDEMIVFVETANEAAEHWASNEKSGRLAVYSYKNGRSAHTAIDLPYLGHSAYQFYLTSKSFIVLSDARDGCTYHVYQYKDGSLANISKIVDGTNAGKTYYSVNGVEVDKSQYTRKMNEYNADQFTVTISVGQTQLSRLGEDILPTMQDDTEEILKMTAKD